MARASRGRERKEKGREVPRDVGTVCDLCLNSLRLEPPVGAQTKTLKVCWEGRRRLEESLGRGGEEELLWRWERILWKKYKKPL